MKKKQKKEFPSLVSLSWLRLLHFPPREKDQTAAVFFFFFYLFTFSRSPPGVVPPYFYFIFLDKEERTKVHTHTHTHQPTRIFFSPSLLFLDVELSRQFNSSRFFFLFQPPPPLPSATVGDMSAECIGNPKEKAKSRTKNSQEKS